MCCYLFLKCLKCSTLANDFSFWSTAHFHVQSLTSNCAKESSSAEDQESLLMSILFFFIFLSHGIAILMLTNSQHRIRVLTVHQVKHFDADML